MNTTIAIDVRKIRDSGIGTYIQNLIPLVIQALPQSKFYLLGKAQQLQEFSWTQQHHVALINIYSPVFSISEQIELSRKIPPETTLFWSTHFNVPLLYRGRLLVTIYDMALLAVPQSLPGLLKKLYVYGMFFSLRAKADGILSISHFTANELVRLIGVSPDRVKPVHLGISKSWFEVSRQARPHPRPYIIFIGNIKPNKNVVRLLQAFALVLDKVSHDLIIIGRKDGFITADTATIVQPDSRIEHRILFTGYVGDKMLQQYIVHADALVFPSLYEGFGFPPLEAMACGCPVIVSNTASLPEVCGEAALYCDPYSPEDIARQMVRVLTDQTLRDELRKKGYQRALTFSWEKCTQETIAEIEKFLIMD